MYLGKTAYFSSEQFQSIIQLTLIKKIFFYMFMTYEETLVSF